MASKKLKGSLLAYQLWCSVCLDKIQPIIRPSTHLVPHRTAPYDMLPGEASIDNGMVGVCDECLKTRNKFQQSYYQIVELADRLDVYKCIRHG